MAGFTTAFSRTTLDSAIVNGDIIKWYEDSGGTLADVAATTVSAWTASTDADPAVRSNTNALTSAGATAGTTVTHFAIFDSAGTTQKTDITALNTPRTLVTNDTLSVAAGEIDVTMT